MGMAIKADPAFFIPTLKLFFYLPLLGGGWERPEDFLRESWQGELMARSATGPY